MRSTPEQIPPNSDQSPGAGAPDLHRECHDLPKPGARLLVVVSPDPNCQHRGGQHDARHFESCHGKTLHSGGRVEGYRSQGTRSRQAFAIASSART
jgi:hypothetical protein